MLQYLFSSHQRHSRYAVAISLGCLTLLLGGYIAVKWLFLGEFLLPSLGAFALIIAATILFARLHIASMKGLDAVPKRSQPE
jgi:hypothetical protein